MLSKNCQLKKGYLYESIMIYNIRILSCLFDSHYLPCHLGEQYTHTCEEAGPIVGIKW